jgi:hypothetical protein
MAVAVAVADISLHLAAVLVEVVQVVVQTLVMEPQELQTEAVAAAVLTKLEVVAQVVQEFALLNMQAQHKKQLAEP